MVGYRVLPVCGDLERAGLGLPIEQWQHLAGTIVAIYHNGASVNYLLTYERMRDANVVGTNEVLRLAFETKLKEFQLYLDDVHLRVATKDTLFETDNNIDRELLDFGYSQSKWVAERVVSRAAERGLPARIFRPALVTRSVAGGGSNYDITIRLLAFMMKHTIGVRALNQVSFMPAEVTANNIVAISSMPGTVNGTFRVTRDEYCNMMDITDIIARVTGRPFKLYELRAFVTEVIKCCTKEDILFPLLDFLIGSIDNITSMEFKRYDSARYRQARDTSRFGIADPTLENTVQGILRFIEKKELV